MKLTDALSKFGPVRGMTSMIAGLLSADPGPIGGGVRVSEGLSEARAKLAQYQKLQNECQSDWAYWGYQGDISYWSAVADLLEAAEITGPDNLPDIHYDDRPGVVMDMCGRQEDFGKAVLAAAKRGVQGKPTDGGK